MAAGGRDRRHIRDDMRHCKLYQRATHMEKYLSCILTEGLVLSASAGEALESAYPAQEVTKVALRLKHQLEQVMPIEIDESKITRANSPIITRKVVQVAKQAGGKQYPSCIIYCLLVCKRWFKRQALLELWDSDLHEARAVACEVLAKKM